MNLKSRLGQRIQELRLKNNLKQSELAERVNIATKHQSCIETGKNYPSAELIERYAQALNIDVAEIFDIKNIQSRELQIQYIQDTILKINDDDLSVIYKFIHSFID